MCKNYFRPRVSVLLRPPSEFRNLCAIFLTRAAKKVRVKSVVALALVLALTSLLAAVVFAAYRVPRA